MTSKGQVTVPKRIRDALGLLPGHDVEFELNADGDAVLRKARSEERIKAREQEIIAAVKEARKWFRDQDTMAGSGMDGVAYQRWIRGPGPDEA